LLRGEIFGRMIPMFFTWFRKGVAMRSPQEILEELRHVRYPGMTRDIVSFGMVKDIEVGDSSVCVDLVVSSQDPKVRNQIESEVKARVHAFTGLTNVEVKNVGTPARSPGWREGATIKGVKYAIAVGSGKGGVGKSTVSVNLALALQRAGASVGLLDADVYGPSVPAMLGGHFHQKTEGDLLVPLEKHSVKMMSMGLLTTEDTPVIWRGPMATKLIHQFLTGVKWGDLDYLIIDLPPGTGDVQLTLTQSAPLAGAIIVTTPQDVALNIARKGLRMFQQVRVPVLGMIENMSYFECPHCHERSHIFKSGGARKAAEEIGVPFLGQIPLDAEVVEGGDEGVPIVVKNPASAAAKAFQAIAQEFIRQLEGRMAKDIRPVDVRLIGDTELAIPWSDGHQSIYSFHHLRVHCPCAACVDEWTGKKKVSESQIRPDIRPLDFSPVGRYAIGFRWSDGHSTGIYTFERMRSLCQCSDCLSGSEATAPKRREAQIPVH
jgi:ATP-binding protein involved in chromosome partitioning